MGLGGCSITGIVIIIEIKKKQTVEKFPGERISFFFQKVNQILLFYVIK